MLRSGNNVPLCVASRSFDTPIRCRQLAIDFFDHTHCGAPTLFEVMLCTMRTYCLLGRSTFSKYSRHSDTPSDKSPVFAMFLTLLELRNSLFSGKFYFDHVEVTSFGSVTQPNNYYSTKSRLYHTIQRRTKKRNTIINQNTKNMILIDILKTQSKIDNITRSTSDDARSSAKSK